MGMLVFIFFALCLLIGVIFLIIAFSGSKERKNASTTTAIQKRGTMAMTKNESDDD